MTNIYYVAQRKGGQYLESVMVLYPEQIQNLALNHFLKLEAHLPLRENRMKLLLFEGSSSPSGRESATMNRLLKGNGFAQKIFPFSPTTERFGDTAISQAFVRLYAYAYSYASHNRYALSDFFFIFDSRHASYKNDKSRIISFLVIYLNMFLQVLLFSPIIPKYLEKI